MGVISSSIGGSRVSRWMVEGGWRVRCEVMVRDLGEIHVCRSTRFFAQLTKLGHQNLRCARTVRSLSRLGRKCACTE